MMAPLVNELCRTLQEGIVGSVAEADMAMIYGLGFPAHRGGVLRWVDSIGVRQFCEQLNTLRQYGPLYQTEPMMSELAEQGTSFYDSAATSATLNPSH
jgi:3-hydroxyacyl-CoA dehydrogenase/enoyl-CoA hydratase/3-hydroxybutyryl-CoA epimerase/enoyl-CoA isomerase